MRIEGSQSLKPAKEAAIKESTITTWNSKTVFKENRKDINAESLSLQEIAEATKVLNNTMDLFKRRLRFNVHEETNRIWVQVVDKDTGKVLKEIPPEKVLDMVAKFEEMIGLLIDEWV